jgi:hypothetical protein
MVSLLVSSLVRKLEPLTDQILSCVATAFVLEKFTVTGDAGSIPATEWVIVRAMVARPKDRVNAEANHGHEQKENNPMRNHGVLLTFLVSPDLKSWVLRAA